MAMQLVIEKFVDWLGKQQSSVVVLILILITLFYGIFYGLNTMIPDILDRSDKQMQVQREYDREQRELDRKAHETEGELNRKAFESVNQQNVELHRQMLQKVFDFIRTHGLEDSLPVDEALTKGN